MLCVSHVCDRFLIFTCIFKACKRSLRRLCFHRCLSVQNGVCIPARNGQRGVCVSQNDMGQGGVCPGGVCPGGVCPGGCLPRGMSVQGVRAGVCSVRVSAQGEGGVFPGEECVFPVGECVCPGGRCLPGGVYHIPNPKTATKAVSTGIHSCE